MELYFAMVNIIDYLALHKEIEIHPNNRYIGILNYLASEYVKDGESKSIKQVIADVADANDAGGCTSWVEIVANFREQFENGERISFH